ncbi:MAG: RIP metalloprotease RseP [Planctomycetes bacterium]|nr:RIP metalloprotease RseP [Planctomycetota bacterium]
MLAILLTILGIGFLLFIHELGHFLAARAAGVRVEVFALGMGPRLFGFRRGDTDYRISALPIGGYVQMAGESSVDRKAPDGLLSKSVAARFFIFSGGIIMNFLFALIMVPLLFRIGVPMQAPQAGSVFPGSAAWHVGIKPGDRFTNIDDDRIHSFADFASTVALSDIDQPMRIKFESTDHENGTVQVAARPAESTGLPELGVGPMPDFAVEPNSPATTAGLIPTDKVIGFGGVRMDQFPGVAQAYLSEIMLSGATLQIDIERDGVVSPILVAPEIETLDQKQLGVFEAYGKVLALREGHGTALQQDDFLLRVGKQPVRAVQTVQAAAFEAKGLPSLTVLRAGESAPIILPAQPEIDSAHFAAHVHLGPDPEEVRVVVRPEGPAAAAGMRNGDRLLRIGNEDLVGFQNLRNALKAANGAPFALQVVRETGEIADLEVQAHTATVPRYGIAADVLRETVRETHLVAAIGTGLTQARTMVRQVFLSLHRIVTGAIPATNLGGIITISRTGHHFATNGLIPFLFFLCMISVHLGVLNLLPIPALDGGHLFFLLIEAVRGRPVSQQVMLWFNFSGFVLLMGLVIFVTILDIGRLVP